MAHSGIIQAAFLVKLVSDPSSAILQQSKIPAETTCSLMRASRRMLGILNKADEIELTEQFLNALRFIAEHDPIYYLSLIGRFDLIREIFNDNDLFETQMALLDEIEKDKAHQKNLQELLIEQERQTAKSKLSETNTLEQHYTKEESRLLADLHVYCYLYAEQHRIYQKYYDNQTVVYMSAFEGRTSRIKEAIAIADQIPEIPHEDRKSLTRLLEEYQQEFRAIAKKTTISNGALDWIAVDKKLSSLKRIDDKYAQLFTTILEKHQDINKISDLLAKERTATESYRNEIHSNEIIRDQELDALKPYLEGARATVKADLKRQMNQVLDVLKTCDVKLIPAEKRAAFKMSLHKLHEQVDALSKTNDDNVIRDIATKFATEIGKVKPLVVTPVLKQDEYIKLNRAVGLFGKIYSLFNDTPMLAARNEQLSMPHPPADEEMSSPPPYDQSKNNSNNQQVESFQRSKDSISFFRAESPKENLQQNMGAGEGGLAVEEKIILDDEKKKMLRFVVNELSMKLGEMEDQEGLGDEITQLITETQLLCKEFKSTFDSNEVFYSKIERLNKNVQILKLDNNELNDPAENLDNLIDSIEDSPRLIL